VKRVSVDIWFGINPGNPASDNQNQQSRLVGPTSRLLTFEK
jgi:hypothetical protein